MQVLFTCGREPEYPRNAILRTCLERSFSVLPVTEGTPWLPLRYARLAIRLLRTPPNYDLMCVGFLGQPLMPLARQLTRKPIMLDAFLSIYDTLCFDRCYFTPYSLAGQLAFRLDRASCALADLVVLDTQAHADYFCRTFGVPPTKLRSLFVGCDERIFYPYSNDSTSSLVLFYGSFLPLQGIDVIIRAAKLLEAAPKIRFRIIGKGMEYARIRHLADRLDVQNVEFRLPVPLSQLPNEIAQAAVCLGGHFSTIDKATRVIAGKTFQCLAMGKPTVVGDNTANRELLTPGYDAWFCPMGNPEALASAILTLIHAPELRAYLGRNAYQTFLARASIDVLSQQVRQMVERLINSGTGWRS